MTNEIVKDRGRVYGDPLVHFPRVAQVWSGILGHEVTAIQVALCMIGLKVIRTEECPTYSDNSDDVAGYLDIVRQLVGPDMIQARSTQEYLDKLGLLWSCPNPACLCKDESCGCHLDPNRCAESIAYVSGESTLVHNHDLDPSCRERTLPGGQKRGQCLKDDGRAS